jgi:hypothetical protein
MGKDSLKSLFILFSDKSSGVNERAVGGQLTTDS